MLLEISSKWKLWMPKFRHPCVLKIWPKCLNLSKDLNKLSHFQGKIRKILSKKKSKENGMRSVIPWFSLFFIYEITIHFSPDTLQLPWIKLFQSENWTVSVCTIYPLCWWQNFHLLPISIRPWFRKLYSYCYGVHTLEVQ